MTVNALQYYVAADGTLQLVNPGTSILPTAPGEINNGNSGAAATVNWAVGPAQRITLTANCTVTSTGLPAGSATWVQLKCIQDGTGSRTLALAATKTPGGTPLVLSATPGATDIVSLYWDGAQLWATLGGPGFA